MKLKKIASLMLAGVMAVSMLAGCGESSSSSSEPTTPPTTTVTTGIADAVNAVRSTREKNTLNLTYTESSSLAEILQVVAQDAYSKNSDAVKTAGGADGYDVAKYVGDQDSMNKKISDKLTGGAVAGGYNDINGTIDTKGTHKYVRVYTVGGNYSIEAAGNMVATMAGQGLHVVTDDVAVSGTGTTADYAADIAAVKVTSNVDSKVNAWVIAVVYTQTVTAA